MSKELKSTKVIVKSFSDDITVSRDYYCENCAGYITSGRFGNIKYDIKNNVFCKHCGQKLDWSDEK